ncbi:Wadjet anti-phage system protein JetD domain-containing protein [Roseateles sp.]|uniref:Wadjet anti-phage system protein JetD domain-containing protein n=1 Tax=Roseateles sp. TaxID=1971397 RepID=UPI0039EC8257
MTRLLSLAENAAARESSGKTITLRLSAASFPDYLQLQSASVKAECNAAFLLAEHRGAISIQWDARAGDRAHAERLDLVDGQVLAKHLGVTPRWDAVGVARKALEPHVVRYPALDGVVDCWRRGATARGTRPSDVSHWLDAIRIIEYCETLKGQDIPVRRASAKLFGDSKRIQGLSTLVDVLTQGSVGTPLRDEEEVLQELGLVRFPPTWMLAAEADVLCAEGTVKVVAPYVGLAPTAIQAFRVSEGTRGLMTVENLTTFHEAAQRRSDRPDIAVVYTGGMPSPSWCRVYVLLLQALPASARVSHWGDVDAGGFRIAGHLAALCEAAGRQLTLHSMSGAASHPEDGLAHGTLGAGELSQVRRICERWGWQHAAAEVEAHGLAVEQESMSFTWPEISPNSALPECEA